MNLSDEQMGKIEKIIAVYDKGDEAFGRYTVLFVHKPWRNSYTVLSLSDFPDEINGLSEYDEISDYSIDSLGKQVDFFDLPEGIQIHISNRLGE